MADGASGWFVYEHTVEGLFFKALRSRLTPALEQQLKVLGIDVKGKPKSVPQAQWVRALELAATALFEGSTDERFRQLGHAVMLRYEETVMGKAVITVMRLMGPKRILGRINSTLRSGNNFIEASLSHTGPNSCEGTVNECNGNPHYIAGVLEQGLLIAGAKSPQVLVSEFNGHSARFQISWV